MSARVLDFNDAKRLTREEIKALEAEIADREVSTRPLAIPAFEPRKTKFPVEYLDDLKPSFDPGIIKGIWPRQGLAFVYGPSMSGKSFLMLDIAARVARGAPVFGRRSKACGVLYIASEDPGGVRLRLTGLRQHGCDLGRRFAMIGRPPNLTDEADVDDLSATIRDVKDSMATTGLRLGLVVIDTFSASTAGADENSGKEMGQVVASLQTLAEQMSLLVVVVHHTGKDATRGARGWSGLFANADSVIALDKPRGDGVRVARVEKVKNGEAGWEFAFNLRSVGLGYDEDGDPVTTCVVEEVAVPEAEKRRTALNPRQQIMLRAIKICLDNGQVVPVPLGPGIPAGSVGVSRRVAKTCALREGLCDDDMSDAARKKALNDAILALRTKDLIREQEGVLMLLE